MAISLRHLKTLSVSAASGLIILNEYFYVIADDELSLLKFPVDLKEEADLISIFDGELPSGPVARKKVKPDFEAVVKLSEVGPILVLPSGSKPNRTRGACLNGRKVTEVNFGNLYAEVLKTFPELNIEGAVVNANKFLLFQRGNGKLNQNGIITLDTQVVLRELATGAITSEALLQSTEVKLGKINDVPLSFTDAAVESADRIWFVAAAEASEDTFSDGEFAGAVLGALNSSGEIIFKEQLRCDSKPEGLCLNLIERKFYVVTDSDNSEKKSELLMGHLPDLASQTT